MRNELIRLITKCGKTENENGFTIETEEAETELFARVKTVRASEFYQAYSAGIELSYIFCVDTDDLMTAKRSVDGKAVWPWAVDYEGTRYKIVRRYQTDSHEVELSCQEADHGNDI